MTLNREKKKNVSKLIELMFKGELLFLQGCVLKSRLVRGMFKLVESVFEHHSCWCVYFQILYNTMDFYKWKLNLTWITCKTTTEITCWMAGMRLTLHITFCTCYDSIPKSILVCVGTCKCNRTPFIDRPDANTSSPDIYWRKRLNWWAHLELCHRNPDNLGRVLNRIALSNSIAGKCTPMQVIKQAEHGKTSTTKEQKWSFFHMNYD